MRTLNGLAACSGLVALIMLAFASQGDDHGANQAGIAALVQLISAAIGVFAAGRAWRFDLGGGGLIVAGGTLFMLSAIDFTAPGGARGLNWFAFLGGASMMLGWVTLAFSRPVSAAASEPNSANER